MPLHLLQTLRKSLEDLISTEVSLFAFSEEVTKTLRVFLIETSIGSKTFLYAFFMVDSTTSYQALLGRNIIHSYSYVPSSLHQFLLFLEGG